MADVKIRPGGAHRGAGAFKAKTALPGPGSHDIPCFPGNSPSSTVPGAAAFSMASARNEHLVKKARAGPGSYYPRLELTRASARSYGFGRSRRLLSNDCGGRRSGSTPAPDLKHADNKKFDRPPGYCFGSEEKFFRAPGLWSDLPGRGTKMPGPGEHNPADHISSKTPRPPAYSAPPRRDQGHPVPQGDTHGPGPGEYRPENAGSFSSREKAEPKHSFGKCERLMGPGGPGVAGRRRFQKSPGPGAYTTTNVTRTGHNSVGGSAPGWSMPGRQDLDLQ